MKHVYFMTGFPGFLATKLIKKLIEADSFFERAYLLVLPAFESKARQEATLIEKDLNLGAGLLKVITGDITKEGLGLDSGSAFEEVTHVFHLAAIYDLAVPRDVAYEVNVIGTRNMNNWVSTLPSLKRYIYFSTAYVAGKREGLLLETELLRPAAFKNFYEETKFEAELLVEQLREKLPVTIIRPGIVKGDSRTGETVKFDGPYFLLNALYAIRSFPIIPYMGRSATAINLVPVDYILESVSYLSFQKKAEGKTYHLTDPNPYTATEVYEMLAEALCNKKPKGTLPLPLCKKALSYSPVRKFLHIEQETIDYFTWKGEFDCRQAQAHLADANIYCPDFKESVPSMVDFYLKNRHDARYQVKIV